MSAPLAVSASKTATATEPVSAPLAVSASKTATATEPVSAPLAVSASETSAPPCGRGMNAVSAIGEAKPGGIRIGGGPGAGTRAVHTPAYPLPVLLADACCVHARPRVSETAAETCAENEPSEETDGDKQGTRRRHERERLH